jgi:hypothetical protein
MVKYVVRSMSCIGPAPAFYRARAFSGRIRLGRDRLESSPVPVRYICSVEDRFVLDAGSRARLLSLPHVQPDSGLLN